MKEHHLYGVIVKMSLATYPIIISIIQCKTIKDLSEIQTTVFDSELEILTKVELTILINQKMEKLGEMIQK